MTLELLGPAGLVAVPLLAAALIAVVPRRRAGGWISLVATAAAFGLACRLPWELGAGRFLLVDRPGAHLAMLAGFVGVIGAWSGRTELIGRSYHALFQVLLGLTLLSLLAKSPGAAWIGIEASVIAGAVALGSPMTTEAVAAAWRYLVLAAVALGLALFGTAALSLDPGGDPGGDVGFVLAVIGYGAIMVLAPVQPRVPAVLQLPPLLAILRLPAEGHGGPLHMLFGLAALLVSAAGAGLQRDLRRCVSYAGFGQIGVALFAFGLGGAAAAFAGLLQLTLVTLTVAAAMQCADRPEFSRTAATVAMAGLPPFGVFAGWFLVMMATIEKNPWLAAPLAVGLVASGWVLVTRVAEIAAPGRADLVPAWALLAAGVVLGIAMPAPVVAWFTSVAAELR